MTPTKRLLVLLLIAVSAVATCGPAVSPGPTGTLTLVMLQGPVCPVEQDPPDPACAPRPVVGQVVAILDGSREVARSTSDAAGRIRFSLPHGRYTVHPVPPDTGFPTPPTDQVVDLGAQAVELSLDYDTGIR